jgi:KDO2-lipid IV(A) lauroyltransferase
MRLLNPAVGRFPRAFYYVAHVAGWAAWRAKPQLRRKVMNNLLPLCDGDRRKARALGVEVARNVARYYVDLASLPHRDMVRFEADHLRIVNGERLEILDRPGPIMIVSCHTGNPELAIQALTYRGRPFVALVEELQPAPLRDYVRRLRSAVGGAFYDANFKGVRLSIETLRGGGLLGMIADRDIQRTGVCVSLCGRRVKLPHGPWDIARRTGAIMLPVFSLRAKLDDMVVYVEEPFSVGVTDDPEADVAAAAQRWACVLETHLRREPGQWTVTEDFWAVHACE